MAKPNCPRCGGASVVRVGDIAGEDEITVIDAPPMECVDCGHTWNAEGMRFAFGAPPRKDDAARRDFADHVWEVLATKWERP